MVSGDTGSLRGDGMEEGVGMAFRSLWPRSAADEDFTNDFSESKTEQGARGTPGEKENKWGWSVAAVLHIPGRLQPSGWLTPSPPRCRSCFSLNQPHRNLVMLQEGARTPLPSPCPFPPAPNQPPPTSLAARNAWKGGNEGDLKTCNL